MFTQIDFQNFQEAAHILESVNPKLALGLLSSAKKIRSSPALNMLYRELKAKTRIINLVVIGNCQSTPLADLLHSKSSQVYVSHFVTVHNYRFNKSIYKVLDDCDYIITQNISKKFAGINTHLLSKLYPDKLIKILNLYYKGFHPDWCDPKVNGIRLRGPIANYHNQTILDSYIEGVAVEKACERYLSLDYNERYSRVAQESWAELKKREELVDIKMTDYLAQVIPVEACFNTFNHPKIKVLNEEAKRILDFIGVNIEKYSYSGANLDDVVQRVNPICSLKERKADDNYCIGFKHNFEDGRISLSSFRSKLVDDRDMIGAFYKLYDLNSDFIEGYRKSR